MSVKHLDLISRRAFVMGSAKMAFFGGLWGRLYYLQMQQGSYYKLQSDKNRIYDLWLPAERGRILDRDGRVLADVRKVFHLVASPDRVKDWDQTMAQLIAQGILSQKALETAMATTIVRRLIFLEELDFDRLAKFEVLQDQFPGVWAQEYSVRTYPEPLATVHPLGYVSRIAPADLDADPTLQINQLYVGKSGIEQVYEQDMRGRSGSVQLEVNAHGQVQREIARQAGQAGDDLKTMIDMRLQTYAYDLLAPLQSGSVIVMAADTGAILAMTSAPGFDANQFVGGIPKTLWDQLRGDMYAPLMNKATAGLYAPGSVFKLVVALAALEAGKTTPQFSTHCNGVWHLGNHPFHCWKKEGHGTVHLHQAIVQSCDVYFYEMARRLGIGAIADMASRLGMGELSGIDLTDEAAGIIPHETWKQRLFGQKWTMGETVNAAIGQGYVLTSPLQLAVMMAAIANGGHLVTPHIAQTADAISHPIEINPGHLKLVYDALVAVVNEPGGTSYSNRIEIPGQEFAGKTGTSQVRRITLAERAVGAHKHREWLYRDHAVFAGFAPIQKPKYVAAIVVEHGGSGGAVAGPIAKELLAKAQELKI